MAEPWTPPLRLRESGGRCRLLLDGVTHGNGETLQDAADDLIARLLHLVAVIRDSGLRIPGELGPPDHRIVAFLYDVGAIAARGEDIRHRVFGPAGEAGLAA